MITTENLPASYKPYQSINFCSNNIIGGGHIFAMGKVLPLLIGVGAKPRIWLQAVSTPGRQEFITVVNDSKSTHPAVSIRTEGKKVIVSVQGRTVLSAESTGEQSVTISELDFRPIGLNVFGNSSSLSLGGMQMSHNTFSGVGVAFGLGA
jgi:hypothetical protein